MAYAGRTWMVACVVAGSTLIGVVDLARAERPRGSRELAGGPDVVGGYSSRQILVTFRSGAMDRRAVMRAFRRSAPAAKSAEVLGPAVRRLFQQWGGIRLRPAYPFEFGNPQLAAQLGLDRTYIIDVPAGTDTRAMAAAFRQSGVDIEDAGVSSIGSIAGSIPDDPDFTEQYGLHNWGQTGGTYDADIDAPEAWDLHTGNLGTVTIAVIDSGVSPHVEFGDRLLPGANTYEPKRCDDGPYQGELCADDEDCPGGHCMWSDLTIDAYGHGTHVAGIAAAMGNNDTGVAGVTWGAHILPVRVTNDVGSSISTNAATALIWASDNGADVCNLSLQYYALDTHDEQFLRSSVNYVHSQGTLVVAAAGNFAGNEVAAPARFANCMAVSATDHDDEFASYFSNWGDELDVCAPGVQIYSTIPNDLYNWQSGTSMSAPYVAGLAALLKSFLPHLTNEELRKALQASADDLGMSGWDDLYGHGRINAFAAMWAIIDSWPPDGAIDARQPFALDGSDPAGWDTVELTFVRDTTSFAAEDFEVTVNPSGSAPGIAGFTADGYTVTIELDAAIPVGAWTTITHIDSGNDIRLGYLPGDIDADGECTTADVDALLDALNEIGDPPAIWSTDSDRSGRTTARDILRLIDLLNGAGKYDAFLGSTLPH